MEKDIQDLLEKQEQMLQQIYKSVENTRKIIFWTGITTLATFIIPLIVIIIIFPYIISTFTHEIGFKKENNVPKIYEQKEESLSELLKVLNNN